MGVGGALFGSHPDAISVYAQLVHIFVRKRVCFLIFMRSHFFGMFGWSPNLPGEYLDGGACLIRWCGSVSLKLRVRTSLSNGCA